MARIVWTREAVSNLELIRAYIEQFDPNAAARLTARLFAVGESLREYPNRGRPTGDGLREMPTVPHMSSNTKFTMPQSTSCA